MNRNPCKCTHSSAYHINRKYTMIPMKLNQVIKGFRVSNPRYRLVLHLKPARILSTDWTV